MPSEMKFQVTKSHIEEALIRTREQESIYGHNTGHFTLEKEKENTLIGVIGEILVREYLEKALKKTNSLYEVKLAEIGAEADISVHLSSSDVRKIHVKTGLWKSWPQPSYHFGIHADQNIENSGAPLVLVSLLKGPGQYPESAKIEGYITSRKLSVLPSIKRGELFPSTGVKSRTDNILSKFSDYLDIELLVKALTSI